MELLPILILYFFSLWLVMIGMVQIVYAAPTSLVNRIGKGG